MKCFLLMFAVALSANAARAQAAPTIAIGYVEELQSQTIGGQVAHVQNLKFTELKVLGTWTFADKDGQHGYIYVDNAQEAKWENSDLVVPLGERLFEVNRMQRWKTGETALIIDDLDDESAAILRQTNWHAPVADQLEVRWQPLTGTKVRLTISNDGDQTLRLAPIADDNGARATFAFTRDGKPLAAFAPEAKDETAATFAPLDAGAHWQRDFDLNQFADLSQPGHYQVEVNYQLPAQNGDAPDARVTLKFADKFEFDVAAH